MKLSKFRLECILLGIVSVMLVLWIFESTDSLLSTGIKTNKQSEGIIALIFGLYGIIKVREKDLKAVLISRHRLEAWLRRRKPEELISESDIFYARIVQVIVSTVFILVGLAILATSL